MTITTVSIPQLSVISTDQALHSGSCGRAARGHGGCGLTFSYTFNTRSNSFFASLPIRREGMYLTNYLSGLFWFIAANVIIFLLTLLVTAGSGKMDITVLLQWLAIVSLEGFIFYSMATFSATVRGTPWASCSSTRR
jgi:ABC-2 type transport system permease protein